MKKYLVLGLVAALSVVAFVDSASAALRFFETDRLEEGAHHQYQIRMKKGETYMVVSASSQGTVDFDLTVLDPGDNEIIASDSTDKNTDWVRFTPSKDGWHTVKIKAYSGSGWYELIVLNVDTY